MVWYLGGKVARSMGSKRGLRGIIPLIWPTLLMCHKESSRSPLRDLAVSLLGRQRPSKGCSRGPLRADMAIMHILLKSRPTCIWHIGPVHWTWVTTAQGEKDNEGRSKQPG